MKNMSHCRLKSPNLGLLPDEENGKCSIARYCAEFPMVRRVLGGGCGFCDEDQILFSVIASEGGGTVPTDIQGAYSCVPGGLINTLRMLGFDGKLEPIRNAVYSMGRKISGNAQGMHRECTGEVGRRGAVCWRGGRHVL